MQRRWLLPSIPISIHALREEGDLCFPASFGNRGDFYPRPPRGGRPTRRPLRIRKRKYFYPRPPRGGRQDGIYVSGAGEIISIHALREEGDVRPLTLATVATRFLSTPSARRATR